MNVIEILHHFVTHLSMLSRVCLILSAIALFAALTLVCYMQANPEAGWKRLFNRLIAWILPWGVMMLYLGTCMLPIGISLMMMTFYCLFFLVVCKVPSPFSGK